MSAPPADETNETQRVTVFTAVGGESFFVNTFTATAPDAHVIVAPALPGDIITWPSTSIL